MTGGHREAGSLSATTVLLLFFFSTLVLGALTIAVQLRRPLVAAERRLELAETADLIAAEALEALASDPTPQSDGPGDPILELGTREGIEVEELSSRYNPNWMRKWLIDRPTLAGYLLNDATSAVLQQQRFEIGPAIDLEAAFGNLIDVDEGPMTPYGLFNVNTSDETMLEWIVAHRTRSPSRGTEFRLGVINRLAAFSRIGADELDLLFRTDEGLLWPLITAEASWNVHFLPKDLLETIVTYRPFDVPDPTIASLTLDAIRRTTEIGPDELSNLLLAPSSSRIYDFLGTRSWFWRLRVSLNGLAATYTILNTPAEPPFSTGRTALIVERRFDYTGESE